MSRMSNNVKAWRKRTKERLVEAFDNKCGICKQKYPSSLFDFHHRDPEDKDFSLGAVRGNIRSWQRIIEEVRKCVMVCANCHRLIHYEGIQIPEDALQFNESFAEYKIVGPKKKCIICAVTDIPNHQTTCSYKCAAKLKGKVDWDNTDLLGLLTKHNNNKSAVARELNISETAVRKRLKRQKHSAPGS